MSRRKHVGIAGIHRQQKANEQLIEVGNALAAKQIEQMRHQLAVFKQNLEIFATKYKKDIKKDPHFRMHFQKMCQNIGVDPLASNKGFWAELLGFGDFYYQLGIQIIQVCMATRERNGGLIQMDELMRKVEQLRGRNAQDISEDDIIRSIKALSPLGNGFAIIQFGSKRMVQSVPRELNTDQSNILTLAQADGHVTVCDLERQLGWVPARAQTALAGLLNEGICWVDEQAECGTAVYWVPSFFKAFVND